MEILDHEFIGNARRRIQDMILPSMESIYGSGRNTYPDDFRPSLKEFERVCSFYDYKSTGISVLAQMAASGDAAAAKLARTIFLGMDFYDSEIYWRRSYEGAGLWKIPFRRLLLHSALAYRHICSFLTREEIHRFVEIAERHVTDSIGHCQDFFPGCTDLHLRKVNNHAAVIMQGVYYWGKELGRGEWTDLVLDFAERFYSSGHPDGYWEEHTNAEREGGPSLLYTPLTAGCLYDVLDGKGHPREKFVRAGDFHRSFLNASCENIPIADERSNSRSRFACAGLALHSISPEGRHFIIDTINGISFTSKEPDGLAQIYHELDLMRPGPVSIPEYLSDGNFRISLPLGTVRGNAWTAGISALRALNREIQPDNDYALDQQNMVYLSHRDLGPILTGFKSKKDPGYSTFRIGDDAYTARTGCLEMGPGWAQAKLHYRTFDAGIRWEIGDEARLILTADTDHEITTALTVSDPTSMISGTAYDMVQLKGFSPYSTGNSEEKSQAAIFRWKRRLEIRFRP